LPCGAGPHEAVARARWAGPGENEEEGKGKASGLAREEMGQREKACGPKMRKGGEKRIFLLLFPNKFSKLIFKLNLNSIQILVKTNHYKNKFAAACMHQLVSIPYY